jgi:hypothetical protein
MARYWKAIFALASGVATAIVMASTVDGAPEWLIALAALLQPIVVLLAPKNADAPSAHSR